MPKLTKMSNEEIEAIKVRRSANGERTRIRQQYIDFLKNYKPGDWITVELYEGEKRPTVKNRLKVAAKELGYELRFLRSREVLRFEILKAKK